MGFVNPFSWWRGVLGEIVFDDDLAGQLRYVCLINAFCGLESASPDSNKANQ